MPRRVGRCAHDFGEELLGCRITVQHIAFSPFLVVEDKLHGHPGLAWPVHLGPLAAIADHVARIRLLHALNSFGLGPLKLAMKHRPWIRYISVGKMHALFAILQMLPHGVLRPLSVSPGQLLQDLLMLIE